MISLVNLRFAAVGEAMTAKAAPSGLGLATAHCAVGSVVLTVFGTAVPSRVYHPVAQSTPSVHVVRCDHETVTGARTRVPAGFG